MRAGEAEVVQVSSSQAIFHRQTTQKGVSREAPPTKILGLCKFSGHLSCGGKNAVLTVQNRDLRGKSAVKILYI